MGRSHRLVGLYVVLLLFATTAIGYRTFVPRDTLDPAQGAYPAPARATPRWYGAILNAPLVIDGRLRVYGAQREVWADAPVDMRSSMSPYWAYRRWPQTLLGVVVVGTTVVSRWSDGDVVAIDATRGRIAWRLRGPAIRASYAGRRTGAATVYAPPGMYTEGGTVILTGDRQAVGYDGATGRLLWTKPASGCSWFTGPSVLVAQCGSTVDVYDPASGRARTRPAVDLSGAEPFACAVGRSECRGVRTPTDAWVIGADGGLTAAPTLVDPRTWLLGDLVVAPRPGGGVAGLALADGRQVWSWPAPGAGPGDARVVAVEPGAVHLLTAGRDLVTLDPADGLELCRIALLDKGNTMFDPGYVYAVDRFVFVERLLPGAKPGDPESRYYYQSPNVLVTGS